MVKAFFTRVKVFLFFPFFYRRPELARELFFQEIFFPAIPKDKERK
jgi:hypothetical protein